jgi:hypothetical protein
MDHGHDVLADQPLGAECASKRAPLTSQARLKPSAAMRLIACDGGSAVNGRSGSELFPAHAWMPLETPATVALVFAEPQAPAPRRRMRARRCP